MASPTMEMIGFHGYKDALATQVTWVELNQQPEFTYRFENFFHPFVDELIETLNKESLAGMLDPATQSKTADFFSGSYSLGTTSLVKIVSLPKEIDVLEGGPYANYNWELFYHIPLMVATHLSKNQRFAEAQRWFHYIFDPTCNDTKVPPPQRFWKFLPFRQGGGVTQIDQLLRLLSKPDAECTPAELAQGQDHERLQYD